MADDVWLIAKNRLSSFLSDPLEFRDYDIYFLSGIVEGLNERRRFMGKYNTHTRGSEVSEGGPNYADFDIKYPLDLTKDILIPSMAGERSGFAGTKVKAFAAQGSGTLLSMRLINMLRYYVVETSAGAYFGELHFEDTRVLKCMTDFRRRASVYDCGDAQMDGHYPVMNGWRDGMWLYDNSIGGEPSGYSTSSNKVDVLADPAMITNTDIVGHTSFYKHTSDLQSNKGSGYPGNGSIRICQEIGISPIDPVNFPIGFSGNILTPKEYSHTWGTKTFPRDASNWYQWTNKYELFPYEKVIEESGSPYDFVKNGEYVARHFPDVQNPTGNSFMGITLMFYEIIAAIKAMNRFLAFYSFGAVGPYPMTLFEGGKIEDRGKGCTWNAEYVGGGWTRCTPNIYGACGLEYCVEYYSSIGGCHPVTCSSSACPGAGPLVESPYMEYAPELNDCEYGDFMAYYPSSYSITDAVSVGNGITSSCGFFLTSRSMRQPRENEVGNYFGVVPPTFGASRYLDSVNFNGKVYTPWSGSEAGAFTNAMHGQWPWEFGHFPYLSEEGVDVASYSNGQLSPSNQFWGIYKKTIIDGPPNCTDSCLVDAPYNLYSSQYRIGQDWGFLSMLVPDENTFKMITPNVFEI